jgi:sugar phosphate isomerase/epimerase
MRDFSQDHRWLSLNTATIRKSLGADLPLPEILDACARKGIRAVSPWRDQVHAAGLKKVAQQIRALGLELSGYCRGGMFPAIDANGLLAALDENRRAVDEAAELNAPCLVLVVGSLPRGLQGHAMSNDLSMARAQVRDGIGELLEYSKKVGVPLAIEPLHPMYAGDRSCVNTLEQALNFCDELDSDRSGKLGVALDVYHVWWDPKLQQQIARAGKDRMLAFHVCDWLTPTTDMLNDRGMMGDGVIDIFQIRSWVEAQGFSGYSEVEIFSNSWWRKSHLDIIDVCIERHRSVV